MEAGLMNEFWLKYRSGIEFSSHGDIVRGKLYWNIVLGIVHGEWGYCPWDVVQERDRIFLFSY